VDSLSCGGCGEKLSSRWNVCPVCAQPLSETDRKRFEITCSQCDGVIDVDTQICPHCHVPIVRRYCSGCSRLIPDQVSACPHCGTLAIAKRSIFKRLWKPAVAAALIAFVAFTVYFLEQPAPLPASGSVKKMQTPVEKRAEMPRSSIIQEKPLPLTVPAVDAPKAPQTPNAVAQPNIEAAATNILVASAEGKQETQEPSITPVSEPDWLTEGSRLKEGRKLALIGSRYLEQHRYSEAIPALRSAVEAFPSGTRDLTYGLALYRLGYALRLTEQSDEAMQYLKQAQQFPWIRDQAAREMQAARRQMAKSESVSRH